MHTEARTVRAAAVQMESLNSAVERNLERATGFVEEAAARGARLIALPEFTATGYIFTKEIWDAAEPHDGPTARWLRETSSRLGVWIAAGFLEAEGDDFVNTYVLANPEGGEDGRVQKQTPAAAEAYFTEGRSGPHVIDSELGRIGVGICYENQLAFTPGLMTSQSVDLILMPHSAPLLQPRPFFRWVNEGYEKALRGLAGLYAEQLGIPAVMVNKSGRWRSPIPFMPLLKQDSAFPGLSAIADSDGTVKAQLAEEEGVIVEDVTLDPGRKTGSWTGCHGRWSMKETPPFIYALVAVEYMGRAWYAMSGDRKRRALEISAGG
ncbi:MAG: carbon-nitrogen hydrolase family protein [Actinobacteria bacterium]|nr:carbon-nitrogen hydrolase family protein [Actinomycetota bacterium]MBU1942064.1 carbon-nitrogen hydrolase family protein [Actinomycetota bacterium]MBU2687165.1 carbon-nitrogen hydrolase family protein [Actinomycetota bacterium]